MFSEYGDKEEPRQPICCEENFSMEHIEWIRVSAEFEKAFIGEES